MKVHESSSKPLHVPWQNGWLSIKLSGWQPWVSPLLAPRWAMSKLVQQPATRVAKLLLRAAVEGNFHLDLIIPCNYTIFPYISKRKSFGYQNHFDFDGGQPRLPVPLRGTELHASPIKTRRSTRKNHQRCGWTEPSGNKYGSLPP
jgi:hypothetical protein